MRHVALWSKIFRCFSLVYYILHTSCWPVSIKVSFLGFWYSWNSVQTNSNSNDLKFRKHLLQTHLNLYLYLLVKVLRSYHSASVYHLLYWSIKSRTHRVFFFFLLLRRRTYMRKRGVFFVWSSISFSLYLGRDSTETYNSSCFLNIQGPLTWDHWPFSPVAPFYKLIWRENDLCSILGLHHLLFHIRPSRWRVTSDIFSTMDHCCLNICMIWENWKWDITNMDGPCVQWPYLSLKKNSEKCRHWKLWILDVYRDLLLLFFKPRTRHSSISERLPCLNNVPETNGTKTFLSSSDKPSQLRKKK